MHANIKLFFQSKSFTLVSETPLKIHILIQSCSCIAWIPTLVNSWDSVSCGSHYHYGIFQVLLVALNICSTPKTVKCFWFFWFSYWKSWGVPVFSVCPSYHNIPPTGQGGANSDSHCHLVFKFTLCILMLVKRTKNATVVSSEQYDIN